MPPNSPPRRLAVLAVLAVTVAVLGAGVVLGEIAFAASSAPAQLSTTHPFVVHTTTVARPAGLELSTSGAVSSALPSGGGTVTYGVAATVTLPKNSHPTGVAVDSANGNVYVTDANTANVSVISGSSQQVIATIPVGSTPSGVAFDSVNSEVYVANYGASDVNVISTSTNTVVKNIAVPGTPVGVACDSVNGNVYVTEQYANFVAEISGSSNQLIGGVGVGSNPIAAAFDSSSGNLYVANALSDNVSVVNTASNTVVGTVAVGEKPLDVAFDSGNGDVYVTNWLSNNTTVISGTAVVETLPVGVRGVGVAYDPANSVIGIVSEGIVPMGYGEVNFISNATNSPVGNVTVGQTPVGIAYDNVNRFVYVANLNSSNVSVIGSALVPPYAVTFTATNLPSGATFSVELGGIYLNTTGNVTTFSETNGSYAFHVGPVPGYTATPASGTVHVDGFPVSIPVAFSPVTYAVTFTESGLPNGTMWSVTLGLAQAESSNTTLVFHVVNDTYPFIVVAVGFSPVPKTGNLTVQGQPQSVSVIFSPGPSPSSSPSSGTPLWEYVLVAVVVAAVVIGVVVVLVRRRRPPAATTAP